jgi:hypothetical protein
MVHNGNNGNGNHGQWTTTLDVPDNPYVARIKDGAGEDRTDGQSRTVAAEEADLPPIETGRKRKRRGWLLFLCVAALSVICAGLGLYAKYGGRTRVGYQIVEKKGVRPAQITEQPRSGAGGENEPVNQMTSDAINQAKEELRKAGAAAEPAATPEASRGATGGDRQASPGPVFAPYVVPEATIVTDARGAAAPGRVAGQTGGGADGGAGRSAVGGSDPGQPYYRSSAATALSIYVVTPERKASNTPIPTGGPRMESRSATPALTIATVKLPPFGALLPVRTLGVFYTFRNASLARLELTRDLSGDGWSLKRGTVLIAQNQGSVNERAFLSLTGFIDPETNRFIRLAGDVLGGDGGPGLKGKKRKIGGALAPVLNRVANGALAIGQAALSKGGTTVIVPGGSLTGYGSDFGLSQSAVSRREFVEVPAGAPAYVMVTDLPKEVRGVDADPAVQDGGAGLTDEELADLLSKGTPEQIREALPRMPPDMRKVAELTLNAR